MIRRLRPTAGSIAPPSVQALRWWDEAANRVDKITGSLQSTEPLDLDRSVADDGQKLFVRPDVGFERGDVEVAHCDHRTAVLPLCRKPRRELGEKLQFMSEFGVGIRVREISSRRHVDIMKLDAPRQLNHRMSTVVAATPGTGAWGSKRRPRQNRDAVISFHPIHEHVAIAKRLDRVAGEVLVGSFCLLQAKNIRRPLRNEPPNIVDPQPDRVDIPTDKAQRHRWDTG